MARDRILDSEGKEFIVDVEYHPGELLAAELEARGITRSAMALKVGMYPSHFNDIVKKKRNITASIALKLEAALGIAAEVWMDLQTTYELHIERNKLNKTA